jgi:hypothetical protein
MPDKDERADNRLSRRTAAKAALWACIVVGITGLLAAAGALEGKRWGEAGTCLIASAVAFAFLLNYFDAD